MELLNALIQVSLETGKPRRLGKLIEMAVQRGLVSSFDDFDSLEKKAISTVLRYQEDCLKKGLLPFIEYFPDTGFCRPLNYSWESLSDEEKFKRSKHLKRKELVEAVRSLSDEDFQLFCAKLLERMGFQNCRVSERIRRDKGIDFTGELYFKFVKINVIGQAKKYSEGINVSEVDIKNLDATVRREQISKMRKYGVSNELFLGVLITTSRFTKPAIDFSKETLTPLKLIDIDELVVFLINHNIGFMLSEHQQAFIDLRHPLKWFNNASL
jgi:hypothetical protein